MEILKVYDLSSLTSTQRERVEATFTRKKKKQIIPSTILQLWYIVINYGIPVVMVLKLMEYKMPNWMFGYLVPIHWIVYSTLVFFYIIFLISKEKMYQNDPDEKVDDALFAVPYFYGCANWIGKISYTRRHLFMVAKVVLWFALGHTCLGIFAGVIYFILCSMMLFIKEKSVERLEEIENRHE